ncbi:MAG: YSC84-related protein [Steroidobacteraceae bacterium]|jgi:lipid-binding SYLF domain-containing protein
MKALLRAWLFAAALAIPAGVALADAQSDTLSIFRHAGESGAFFSNSYGYAVFPTIGKGGLGVGGAYGTGRVYEHGKPIGHVSMAQVSVGLQGGGEAYSEIIFFQDKLALDRFTGGNFEFSGDVGATAITASASASAGTTGENSGASADKHLAATQGQYTNGVAVFTVAKGGLMYNATIAGQKFSFDPYPGSRVAEQ